MRRSVGSPRRKLFACHERGRTAARRQEGGLERLLVVEGWGGWGGDVIFWGFCHLHHLVGREGVCSFFAQHTQGTNVTSAEQLGLTDDLHMRGVGTAARVVLTAQRLSAGEDMREKRDSAVLPLVLNVFSPPLPSSVQRTHFHKHIWTDNCYCYLTIWPSSCCLRWAICQEQGVNVTCD